MLIYGSRVTPLNSKQLLTETCPSCNKTGSMAMGVLSKHAHFFWIPMFPIGKVGIVRCTHCKYTAEEKEMTTSMKSTFSQIKGEVRPPLWKFAGLGILAVLIVWGNFANTNDNEEDKQFLLSPKEGDVYEIRTSNGNYSTMKVTQVKGDSVWVLMNQYESSRTKGLDKIDKPENYMAFPIYHAKQALQAMYEKDEIIEVNR